MTDSKTWRVITRTEDGAESVQWVQVQAVPAADPRARWIVRGLGGAANAAVPELGILSLCVSPVRAPGTPMMLPVEIVRPGEHTRAELLAEVDRLRAQVVNLGGTVEPLAPFSPQRTVADVIDRLARAVGADAEDESTGATR